MILILAFSDFEGERFHSCFRVLEVHDQTALSDQLELHVVELPKLGQALAKNEEPTLVSWGKFLTAATDDELEELAMTDPVLRQAKAALDRLSADPEARIRAEQREMALTSYRLDLGKAHKQGYSEGKAEGRAEGKAEGRAEGKAELLLRLLTARFGAIAPEVAVRIAAGTEAQLERWSERLFVADSLDAALSD